MNDKKLNLMSENISDLLIGRLGNQMSVALISTINPVVIRMGDALEQILETIQNQNNNGIDEMADSFFVRLTQKTNDYNIDIIEHIRDTHELQVSNAVETEKLFGNFSQYVKERQDTYAVEVEKLFSSLLQQNQQQLATNALEVDKLFGSLSNQNEQLINQIQQERQEHLSYMKQSLELMAKQHDMMYELQEKNVQQSLELMTKQHDAMYELQEKSMNQSLEAMTKQHETMYSLQEKYMQQSLELMEKQHDTMLIQQENQNLLSARMEQMNVQSRLTEEQLQQAMSMSEKLDQNQVELQNHMEEILSSFSGEQKHWLENLAICSNDLEQKADKIQTNLGQQTEMIQNNLSQQTETIQLNLGAATEALLEVSVNAKNSMELLGSNFELFQNKTEESLTGIFGIMDEQIAGIAKSLGQSAVEISEAASTVPRAMRSVIEEMKQAKSC